jgi:hypothetical protein
MSTEVMKKEESALAVTEADMSGETVLNSDVIIPKLLLMQGLSELVSERKATQGDMVRSTTGEKLGDPEHPVSFIPITFKNYWLLQEKVGDKPEYRGMEPRNAANEMLEWEFKKNGADWKRTKVINVFALLPQDIDAETSEIAKFKETGIAPDLNKTLLPVVISFRSTGYSAGRAVATHFTKAKAMKKFNVKPYAYYMNLSCYADKNAKGTFYVFDVKPGGQITPSQLQAAESWYQILSTRDVQVDERDETEDSKPEGYVEMTAHGGSKF